MAALTKRDNQAGAKQNTRLANVNDQKYTRLARTAQFQPNKKHPPLLARSVLDAMQTV